MTDRRLDAGKTQRLHVCSRINELRGNCEQLTKERDELSGKLSELNKIVDTLIDEKRDNRYDPQLQIDLTAYRVNRCGPSLRREFTTAQGASSNRMPTSDIYLDLNTSLSSTSAKDDLIKGVPSDAFKMKLAKCLEDITPKINKITTLTDHLCSGADEL